MREITIESFLADAVRPRGGEAVKMGQNGWPDRIVLMPKGRVGFLELKRPKEEPEPLQWDRIAKLRSLGFFAGYANDFRMVESFVAQVNGEMR